MSFICILVCYFFKKESASSGRGRGGGTSREHGAPSLKAWLHLRPPGS